MTLYSVLYICLCLGFILSEVQIGKIITVEADNTGASFIFPTENFQENDNMYFQVKAKENSFINDAKPVEYTYVNSQESNEPSSLPYHTNFSGSDNETLQNNTKLDIKYFTIQKKSEEYNSLSQTGEYLYINIKVTQGIVVEIVNTKKDGSAVQTTAPAGLMNKITQKYGTANAKAEDYMVVFNVEDFDEGEDMYFKIKAELGTFLWNYIFYEYIDDTKQYEDKDAIKELFSFKVTYDETPSIHYETRYFTIKKEKKNYNGANGKYLLIYFMVDYGDVTITNTEEDEGKFETWKIIVIVVAVVVVVVVVIGCYCYRRKKQLAQMNAVNQQQVYPSSNVVVDQNIPYDQQQNVYY